MKLYALSTLFNGNEMIRALLDAGIALQGVIGLADGVAGDAVSGYEPPKALCRKAGIDFIPLSSYAMSAPEDRETIAQLDMDACLILGWQRLVPDWFLSACKIGAIGVHGSANGITGGRGRSPQNWALLLGKGAFHLSIFFADPGVDSGPVIDSKSIDLSPWDDIKTSHLKVGKATVDLIARNLENGHIEKRICTKQEGQVSYMPQRTPEDGEIDWCRSSHDLYNFIRALTLPYPGAFSFLGGQKLQIWKARPFADNVPVAPSLPGTILDHFNGDELLIATGNGTLYVDDYVFEGPPAALKPGAVLTSADFAAQMTGIAKRHRQKYPDMPLHPDFDRYLPQ